MSIDVIIPTVGRASLATLRERLAGFPGRVIVIEDMEQRGPARARNNGWRRSDAEWVAFLDDDVLPGPGWVDALALDLDLAGPRTAGSQGRIRVPLPRHRPPTDWERCVAGLEGARWATADMAYRRTALAEVGGFDERFPRAFREDADLALRLLDAGWELHRGSRETLHPPGPAPFLKSVRLQAGNADDALMSALHGRGWPERAGAPRGRRPLHLATTAALAVALATRSRLGWGAWAALTAEFALRRIFPGPRTPGEVSRVGVTSVLIPPAATWYFVRGGLRARRLVRPAAVLLDRDGTLVHDVPYNAEPHRVAAVPDARAALQRLRAAGVVTAVVSNQSGIGRGLLTEEQVEAVNRRVEELLGPLGPWFVCPHTPAAGCACRKPAPGLVLRAAEALGIEPQRCVLIGDIGADVQAARAAGAQSILVPNARTRPEEIAAAPLVAPSLSAAVDLVLAEAG
jgi:histidinol-phosphate phosphatase family protein